MSCVRKFLATFLLFASPLFAQQVVKLNPQSSTFALVSGSPFSQYSASGIQYVFPVQPQNAITLYLRDSAAGPDTLTVSLFCTVDGTDPAVNPSATWFATPIVSNAGTFYLNLPTPLNPQTLTSSISISNALSPIIEQSVVTGATQCAILLNGGTASADLLSALVSVSPATSYIMGGSLDPCSTLPKSTNTINIAAAGNSIIVNSQVGSRIYVCGYNVSMIGASQTFAIGSGTGGTCTAPTQPTGAMGPGTLAAIDIPMAVGGTTYVMLFPGQNLCALATGAAVNIQGHISYVYR